MSVFEKGLTQKFLQTRSLCEGNIVTVHGVDSNKTYSIDQRESGARSPSVDTEESFHKEGIMSNPATATPKTKNVVRRMA